MNFVEVTSRLSLRGDVRVPGDKSGSHRAVMLSALADGTSVIHNLSPGEDVASTMAIVTALGARVEKSPDGVVIEGPNEFAASAMPLDCGNSGTTMRLMSGILAATPGQHCLVGDASLSRRPMDRVAVPLSSMGANVVGEGPRVCAPLTIVGHSLLRAIDYDVPTPSAQVKSSIMFAALRATGVTTVAEAVRTRSTTESMMVSAGISVQSIDIGGGRRVSISPGRPRPHIWNVPGDPSQAAFFVVLALIHRDADISIVGVESAPERTGFLSVLRRMGAVMNLTDEGPYLHIHAQSSQLQSTDIHSSEIPSVDEVPVLTVASAAALGVTAFRDMGELRLKESDRFAGSLQLAQSLGCRVWSEGDDFFVEGLGSAEKFEHFEIAAGLDHRMVMSSAVAGVAGKGCRIGDWSTVSSSYPNFFEHVASLS